MAGGKNPNYLQNINIPVTTGAAASGAVTVNDYHVQVTSESLTTAAGATYTLTLTNNKIKATSIVLVTVGNGSNSAGTPSLASVTPASGSVVIIVQNIHASAALNGTLKFNIVTINPV